MSEEIKQPDFIPEVEKLLDQIKALQERIELVERNKAKVRPKIYEKVRADYETKLQGLFDQMSPYQEKIEAEIGTLQDQITVFSNEIETLEEELEELQLRHLAGEFTAEEFEPKQTEQQQKISEKKQEIQARTESISALKTQLSFITGEPLEPEEAAEIAEEEVEEAVEKAVEEAVEEEALELPEEEEEQLIAEEMQEEAEEFLEEESYLEEDLLEEEASESDEEFDDFEDVSSEEEDELISDIDLSDQELEFPDDALGETGEGTEEFASEIEAAQDQDQDGDEYIWTSTPILDVVEGDFAGESFPMDKERMTIGRGPNNDIQLPTDTSVSRHHAQLSKENNRYVLVDLESSNGSSVNGIRVTRTYLRPNDEIMIGTSRLVIRPSNE